MTPSKSDSHKISASLRKMRIREQVMRSDEVSIPDLAVHFGVSEMTIRRDLIGLEREGQVHRTHGGAIASERMAFEFDFRERRLEHQEEKCAIAREAAKLVRPGQRLMLDTGTTTLELAQELKNMSGLTIITPSLAVASALQFSEGIQTILLGGILRKGRPDLTGAVTSHTLDLFAADIVFQGADAIDLNGWIYNEDMVLARVDQKMREQTNCTVILADSSKIGKVALMRSANLSDIDRLVTDSKLPAEAQAALAKLGVKLTLAKIK